jgi:hypothetical protein
MNLTIHFIFVRNFLTCMELFFSGLIFFHKQEKRKYFILRLFCLIAFLFGLSWLIAYLSYLVYAACDYETVASLLSGIPCYALFFLIQIPAMKILFQVEKGKASSIIIFSYVYRQVIFSSYVAIFSLINPHFVVQKFEYLNWPNMCMYLGYCLASYLGMFIYNHKKAKVEPYRIEKPVLIILILAISASVILYTIGECYSRNESDLMYSLLLFSNIISLLLITSVEYLTRKIMTLHNENAITSQLLQEKESQFKFAKANMDRLHIVAHDLKHQTAILREGGVEAKKILDNIDSTVKDYESILITENQTLNVILNEKWHYCEKHSIRLSTIVNPDAFRKLETLELYNLFGNLLDNAIEATRKLDDKEKRTISLNVSYKNGVSMIDMRNYFDSTSRIEEDTSKKDKFNHGYGLKSMKNIVGKYNGDLQTKMENDVFIVKIIIPE